MNDKKIVELIKEREQDKAFMKLYEYFPKVEKLILSKGGSKEDAQDVYQEALIIFYRKVTDTDFTLTSTIGTYLYSVARFLWKDASKKAKKTGASELEIDPMDQEVSDVVDQEERYKLAEEVVGKLGERCIQLLRLFYYEGKRMKEIASTMGFTSEKVAKNQKYKCIERARQQLMEPNAQLL